MDCQIACRIKTDVSFGASDDLGRSDSHFLMYAAKNQKRVERNSVCNGFPETRVIDFSVTKMETSKMIGR